MNSLCTDCGQITDRPSFSEGPKVDDPEKGVIRFERMRYLCPVCLSHHLTPTTEIPTCQQTRTLFTSRL